jgi:hypothetical protein
MWELICLRRHGDMLLCVVRWVHPDSATRLFSLAEVSLTKTAVRWQYYAGADTARVEMERRCMAPVASQGAA